MADLTELESQSITEIPHPALPEGTNIYGGTKVFPDYQAENGESYFTLVHGIAHESSVSFVAILQAILLPVRPVAARRPGGRPHRGRHPHPPARRAGRADPLRPQGRDHQLHLHVLSRYPRPMRRRP
jgi:hypothetical protein